MNAFRFWLKYKIRKDMSVAQYNEGLKYVQKLDLKILFDFFHEEVKAGYRDFDKITTLFQQIEKYDLITHIASCAIKPRFGKWKKHKRLKYCKDINKSMNIALNLCGFFLSKSGLALPSLGNCLITLSKTK